jgi:hypothetical protein
MPQKGQDAKKVITFGKRCTDRPWGRRPISIGVAFRGGAFLADIGVTINLHYWPMPNGTGVDNRVEKCAMLELSRAAFWTEKPAP